MLRLRPYKSCDAETIEKWIRDEEVFKKWGGLLFGDFPISAKTIDDMYRLNNGRCEEPDNFYPWVAFDEQGNVVGHFIMRYLHGDRRILRFGWVIVDDRLRGKGCGRQMLSLGLKYAFEIMGVDKVTIGVYENNESAHRCYVKVGFEDKEIVEKEPWNVIEMEITRENFERRAEGHINLNPDQEKNHMKYMIRAAVPDDESKIRELFIEMLQTIYHTKDVQRYEPGCLDRYWINGEERIFVAEDEGVVAYLSVEVHHDPEGDYIYLDDLSVTKAYRNLGIGSALIREAESYAHEIGIHAILFHVEKSNIGAFRLYERLGYKIFRDDGSRYLMIKTVT